MEQYSALRRFFRHLSLHAVTLTLAITTAVAIVSIEAFWSWQDRSAAIAAGAENTTNLARSVGQHAEDTFRIADVSITGIVARMTQEQFDAAGIEQLRKTLTTRLNYAPMLVGIVVCDAAGDVVVAASLTAPANPGCRDQAYFQDHRISPSLGPAIAAPVREPDGGGWEIILSRRFDHPDGSFGGVVAAALDLDWFQRFYDDFSIGRRGAIALALPDGHLLARRPFSEATVGASIANGGLFRQMADGSTIGTVTIRSSTDGETRINSYRRLSAFPLVVAAALSTDEVLAAWRIETWKRMATAIVLSLVIYALGLGLSWQLRKRRRSELRLQFTASRHELLANNMADLIILMGVDCKPVYVSPACRSLLGFEPEELHDSWVGDLFHPDDRSRVIEAMSASPDNATLVVEATFRMSRKDGLYVWVEGSYRRLPDGTGAVVSIRDISRRKQAEDALRAANARLKLLVTRDELTGLANRRHLNETFALEFRRSVREDQFLSVLMIDVDQFKDYNDQYGHIVGDSCLRAVAEAIEATLRRPGDLVARYGGEEFAVLLPHTDPTGALAIAEDMRLAVRGLKIPHAASGKKIVTISIGASTLIPGRGATEARELMTRADWALYRAKARGRDQVVCADTYEDRPQPFLLAIGS